MPAPLRICHVASEFAPLAKTGGLADVLGALSRYLQTEGHDVRPFLPLYSDIETHGLELSAVDNLQDIPLQLGAHLYRFSVAVARASNSRLPVYLVRCPALYERPGVYTSAPDEHLRFLLLTRAAFEACRRMRFGPQILHCHDWHTAFAPLYLRSVYADDPFFASTRSVLTIHNVGYQGVFPATIADDLGLGAAKRLLYQDDLKLGRINMLRHGILYADRITTVSPTYAHEICTEQYGMGLEGTLRSRGEALTGILNGVDYDEWNPAVDRYLEHPYDAHDLAGKEQTKVELMARLGLKFAPATPLLGIVSRMARQKGFDLLFDTLPRFLETRELRVAVVGNGEARYEDFFDSLQQRFPGKVAARRGYDEELAHLIEAGSDMFLMPSLYEPCGLNQMYSLKYGTVPIVRRTGGLADSVQHFDPATAKGTGIVFNDYDGAAVTWALNTALDWYGDQDLWLRIVRNCMAQDFSWKKQGALYIDLYRSLLA